MTPSTITPFETRILTLLSEGKSHQEIGAIVNLSKRTIEGITADLREKHAANNTVHLVVMAVRNQII